MLQFIVLFVLQQNCIGQNKTLLLIISTAVFQGKFEVRLCIGRKIHSMTFSHTATASPKFDSTRTKRCKRHFGENEIFTYFNVHFKLYDVPKFQSSKSLANESQKLKRTRRTIENKRISNLISSLLKNCQMALTPFRPCRVELLQFLPSICLLQIEIFFQS